MKRKKFQVAIHTSKCFIQTSEFTEEKQTKKQQKKTKKTTKKLKNKNQCLKKIHQKQVGNEMVLEGREMEKRREAEINGLDSPQGHAHSLVRHSFNYFIFIF